MSDAKLQREIFETSRVLEYFTEKELRAQIGHGKDYWPVSILRELIDNSLDACENINVSPEIDVEVKDDFISVTDNGPGIPENIIQGSLNYLIRISDKAFYISPTRGQMGNALKVVYAASFVDCGQGYVEIAANGKLHRIEVTLDRIAGQPKIDHTTEPHFIKNGTFIKIYYPNSTRLLTDGEGDFYKIMIGADLVNRYSAFNPHATFIYNGTRYEATDTNWKKWQPDMPTSPHWYDRETLRDLISGYLYKERQNGIRNKTVREFVSEFRGLSSIAKQKKVTESYSRAYLKDFVTDDDVDPEFIENILQTMQAESKPPKPAILGIIGKEHLTEWMIRRNVEENTIKYVRKTGFDNLPYVVEFAFGVKKDTDTFREVLTGLNWSPTVGDETDPTISTALQNARVDKHDPVIVIMHIARPRFEFMDRGKTRIEL
jgi:DNA topoisomerase VI subunit B